MNTITQNIQGQITYIKEYTNNSNQRWKMYTLAFMGGQFFGLFLKNELILENGDTGLFQVEFKLTQLKDAAGYNKTAYVPSAIIDFELDKVTE